MMVHFFTNYPWWVNQLHVNFILRCRLKIGPIWNTVSLLAERKDIPTGSILCTYCVFPHSRRKKDSFSITALVYFQYDVSWCSFLHASCLWSLWSYLDLCFYSFHQLEIFQPLFPQIFFFPCPLDSLFWRLQLNMYPVAWNYPTAQWGSVNVLEILFSLWISFGIISIAMSSSSLLAFL